MRLEAASKEKKKRESEETWATAQRGQNRKKKKKPLHPQAHTENLVQVADEFAEINALASAIIKRQLVAIGLEFGKYHLHGQAVFNNLFTAHAQHVILVA